MQSENSRPSENLTNVILKKSTDRRPLNVVNFTGGYNNCLRFLHHSVKPSVGVVKYDFSTWHLFPRNINQAKELALKWALSFENRKDFAGKSVVIFFHLQLKTIRVEVKEKQNYIFENENIAVANHSSDVLNTPGVEFSKDEIEKMSNEDFNNNLE